MKPVVSIIMGSISDKDVMSKAFEILDDFNISYEKKVMSAHRAPEEVANFSKSAINAGVKVIIAGAGGAAHLPGVIASMTVLPVIGVPILGKSTAGVDSLLSIVQMPSGIPVATVAINGSANAALLAIEMLALSDNSLQKKLLEYREKIKKISLESNKEL
ncbi:MAG: 5-(carboxyamino)imidazole ribonucleotide mutase [Bacilli bacterium]|nr:5-(carboxyamino)imidazole ribonucleotide mutase [Bacilli bacterium]